MSDDKKCVLFERIDGEKPPTTISVSSNCSVGRGSDHFSLVNNKKVSRHHARLDFTDSGDVMLISTCKKPTYYWENEELLTGQQPKTLLDTESVDLAKVAKFAFLPDLYIYSIKISSPSSDDDQCSPTLRINEDSRERSTSPTLPLEDTEEHNLNESETEPDSDDDWQKISKREVSQLKMPQEVQKEEQSTNMEEEALEENNPLPSVAPKPSNVKMEDTDDKALSPSKRKRILPKWMLAEKQQAHAESTSKPRSTKASPAKPMKEESVSKSTRSQGNLPRNSSSRSSNTRQRNKKITSDDEVSAAEIDSDESDDGSPASRRRQRRAAAVKVSSYAENEFVINNSDFSESDEDAKPKKRRKTTESDEEYDEDNEVLAESGSDYEANMDAKKSSSISQKTSSNSNRRRSSARKGRSSATKRKVPTRRSSRIASSDDDDDQDEEEDDEEEQDEEEVVRPSRNKPAKTEDSEEKKRECCVYGKKCYRKNPSHKNEYSHPGDSDWESESERGTLSDVKQHSKNNASNHNEDLPECEYGTACFRKNPDHLKSFKHTKKLPRLPKKTYNYLDGDEGDDYESGDDEVEEELAKNDEIDEVEDEDWEPSDDDEEYGRKKKQRTKKVKK